MNALATSAQHTHAYYSVGIFPWVGLAFIVVSFVVFVATRPKVGPVPSGRVTPHTRLVGPVGSSSVRSVFADGARNTRRPEPRNAR